VTSDEDISPEASGCIKAFTFIGFAIVSAAFAALTALMMVALVPSISFLKWMALLFGVWARFFLWTVEKGMKNTPVETPAYQEQIVAYKYLLWFIRFELIASLILIFV
jgi:hypothetical protein